MDSPECLQCGTVMVGGDCVTCESAGKKEALVLVASLVVIAVVLAAYASIQLM